MTDSGLALYADAHFSEVQRADILVVPGAGNATSLSNHPEVFDWIQQIHQTTKWTTSVCTGSLILGAAGRLKGRRATTLWAAHDRLVKWGAIAVESRVVEDGKLITAAGVSAGIDMALRLCIKIAGEEFAAAIQLGIEYDPEPPFEIRKASQDIAARVKQKMLKTFEVES